MNSLKGQMEKYELKPNKLLGQNFLVDKNALAKIVSTAELSKNDTVLEIGPGLGALTEKIGERAGKVIAVEKDKQLARILKEKFGSNKNIEVVEGDILKVLGELKIENYKVVANIPYYLTSRLIRLLLESPQPPREIILTIQKEVAERICAKPPKMTLLSAAVQFYAQPKIMAHISKNAFWPKPKVDSAVIKITPAISLKTKKQSEKFFKIIKAGFSAPRKQLLNNLSRGLKYERGKLEKIMALLKIDPKQRAETLSINNWLKLSKELSI